MRTRSGSLGCLGCFSVFVMLGMTAASLGALLWLNPTWFDRAAFWRGPRLKPEASLRVDPAAKAEFERRQGAAAAKQRKAEAMVLLPKLAVETNYAPDRGAKLEMPEGSTLDFPPGSVRGAEKIRVTPVARTSAEMKTPELLTFGQLFDVNIGGRDHYTFDRPVKLTIPYDPKLLPDPQAGRPAIGTWEDGKWVALPTRDDPVNHTLTAELRHASVEGIIVIVTLLTAGPKIATSEPVEALRMQLRKRTDGLLNTQNFAIHYFKSWGAGRPMEDSVYPLAAGRPSGEHPLYIQDVARHLEEVRAGLDKVGTPVAAVSLIRWDVFVVPMHGDYGASPAGGPVMITTDFSNDDGSLGDLDGLMRSTIAHELIHVGQGNFFKYYKAETAARESWWIESTANFLSDRYWRLQGRKADSVQFYLDGKSDLLAKPLDAVRGTETYAYGRFYEWIEKKGDIQAVINRMNAGGTVSLQALDGAVKAAFPDQTLGDLFVEFAKDFYHGSLWGGDVMPIKGGWDGADPARSAGKFDYLTRADGGKLSALRVYSGDPIQLAHFSAQGIHYHADSLPPDRWAKLVVVAETNVEPAARTWVLVGESAIPGRPPAGGVPTPLTPLVFEKSKDGPFRGSYVVKHLATPPDPSSGKSNHVTVVAVNADLVADARPLVVRRWLLLPPEFVSSKRQADKSFRVDWAAAEDARPLWFKGYHVYRRKKGDSEWPKLPLTAKPQADTFYTDAPPDSEDYVYTATVVDKLDNESAPARVEDEDPFQGEWSGKFVLVEGELRTPIMDALHKLMREIDEKERKDIAKIKEKPDRDRALKNHLENMKKNEELLKLLDEYLGKFEQAARLGIPYGMKIRLSEGQYFMKLTRLGFFPVDDKDMNEIPMKRTSLISISPKEPPPENLPPLDLQLIRRDPSQINQVYTVETPELDGKRFKYGIRIQMERERKP